MVAIFALFIALPTAPLMIFFFLVISHGAARFFIYTCLDMHTGSKLYYNACAAGVMACVASAVTPAFSFELQPTKRALTNRALPTIELSNDEPNILGRSEKWRIKNQSISRKQIRLTVDACAVYIYIYTYIYI